MIEGWKTVVAGVAVPFVMCLLLGFAYGRGYEHGKTGGEAALHEARVDRAEEKRREAERFGKALADALAAYEAETVRVNEMVERLQEESRRHERENRAMEKRIADVAGNGAHVFDRDFICMLNAAAGVCDDSVPPAPASAPAAYGASPCAAFGRGLLEGFEGVTEADLLAWFLEYADRCKLMEIQLAGWRNMSQGTGKQ